MNLVSTIMQLLGPVIISRIASSLGIGQGLVGNAISAAVPSILAGLTGSVAKNGAGQLTNVLAKQDPSVLSNLGNLIGGTGQQSLIDSGTNALSSLLGGSSMNALTGALGKFAGLSGGQSSSLLGTLAPVVLGQLAQTQKSSGLDADGLTNLLNSQKNNIAAALPPEFAKLLEGTGRIDSISGNLKSAAPQSAIAEDGFPFRKWLIPLALGLLGLLLLSNYGCRQTTTEKAAVPATAPAETVPVPSADLIGIATTALKGLTTTLGGISDTATATAAVPGLQDIAKQIETVKTGAALLSGDAKKPIATLVAGALPDITAAVEKVVGIPGVAAILNPILQPLVANLDTVAKS
jgi:hypothetical protein